MSTDSDMRTECDKVDKDRYKRDWVYEFSNGEKKEDTDHTDSGIYDGA